MSVVGIDFGNENCYIAVARAGGIETITNDYSQRVTPSYVGFGDQSRDLGVSAKNKQVTNVKNTIFGFKRLLGKKINDPHVVNQVASLPYELVELPDQNIGIKVRYLQEENVFNVQQITAMLFTKLKEIAEAALKIKVNDCVISVPIYFTDSERRALLDAASIAGLNVLRLFNEPTAVALNYGFYKTDLSEEKTKNVVFVDFGHSALQVAACAFNKGKLKILSAVSEPNIGGRVIDERMVLYFMEDFKARYHLDVLSNKRALIRLTQECEKLKKQLSANPNELPLSIECFMNDKDVNGRMGRDKLEELIADLLLCVENCLNQALNDAQLTPEDVEAVEIVGGSSRIPAFKKLITKVFKKEPSTTLNQDEAVARGCALQCAMLSPAFKVREFSITDIQPYSIKLVDAKEEIEVFPRNSPVPFAKYVKYESSSDFVISAYYSHPNCIPTSNPFIGKYTIKNVVPSTSESAKVKVKAKVNIHGIFSILSATMTETQATHTDDKNQEAVKTTTTPMEVDSENGVSNSQNGDIIPNDVNEAKDQPQDGPKDPDEPMPDAQEATTTNKKASPHTKKTKKIELDIDAVVYSLSRTELDNLFEKEGKMVAQDKLEKERVDAKNAVEEYLYEMRAGLSENYEPFVTEEERKTFMSILEDTENWLYAEGENLTKSVYVEKLAELKQYGDKIVIRAQEFVERKPLLEEFGQALQQVQKALDLYAKKDPLYDHINQKDMKKVSTCLSEMQKWYEKTLNQLNKAPINQDPPVSVAAIKEQKKKLDDTVKPILTKPKPQVKPPPEKGAGENNNTQAAKETPVSNAENSEKNTAQPDEQTPPTQDSTMETE